MTKAQLLLLWCAATDRTFELTDARGARVLAGKCIHCNTVLCVALDGARISRATVEHIVPRTHGGQNELENLAVACSACNGEKGVRHDNKHWSDEKLQAMIERLKERRKDRWREPLAGLDLPPFPGDSPSTVVPAPGLPTPASPGEEIEVQEQKPRRKKRG